MTRLLQSVGLVVAAAGIAYAQPASFTDLGDRTAAQTFNQAVTLTAASNIQWYKVILPPCSASDGYVDIWTNTPGDMTDPEIGLYNNSGGLIASDDEDGPGSHSALSFGNTTATRPADGTSAIFNGRDGALAGGTYWVAVGRFNVTFNATGWSVTSSYTGTQRTATLKFNIQPAVNPTNPTGVGTATPNTGLIGSTFVAAVTVSPGANPTSSGIGVSLDAANVNGGTVTLLDDGNSPDATAGDNIFSGNVTVGPAATAGAKTLPFTITDAQSRTGSGNISFTVQAPPATFTDLGDRTTAQTFSQAVTLASATDIQWFKVILPTTSASNGYVDIWTSTPGAITDTEIGVYNNSGVKLAEDDDDSAGNLSALSFGQTSPTRPAIGDGTAFNGRDGNITNGIHWVAVGRFNVTFNAGWVVTSTNATAELTTTLNFAIQPQGAPTPPTGVGSATPNSGTIGATFVAAVTVTAGQFPASTGIAVSLDASNVNGGTVALLDNGVAPDVTAGDNIFSGNVTVGVGTTNGAKSLQFTVSDAELRSSNGNISFTVVPPPPANDECANPTAVSEGTIAWDNASATDSAFAGPSCTFSSPANFHKDIWFLYTPTVSGLMNVGTCGTNQDTVIAIYDTCGGTELACDDDTCDGVTPPGSSLASFIGNFSVSAGVPVYIRVGSWGTSTPAGGAGQLTIALAPSTNPSGVGSATPNSGVIGATFVAAVTVTPGGNPASTGLAVTLDTTNVDGGGVINLLDNGVAPDAVAGDNIFSANVTVGAGATGGLKSLPFSITDAQSRSGSGNISFTVAAPPAVYTDLGTHTATETFTESFSTDSAIKWYKIVLPAVTSAASYVDMYTAVGAGGDPNTDTEIGIYDNSGALIATDDDGSDGLLSQLSHGLTSPARPAIGLGDAFSGQDGALAGGTYWIAVGNFNTSFGNGWAASSSYTGASNPIDLTISIGIVSNPSGVGSATPNTGNIGSTFVASVTVTGGNAPPSTGVAVSLDASLVDGGTVALLDDGVAPDAVAGDGIFSGNVTVGAGATAGLKSLPASITDAESRSGSATVDFTVTIPCPGDINGDGHRDLTDLSILLASFGTNLGDPGYNAAADLNGDDSIGLTDLSILLAVFGSDCP